MKWYHSLKFKNLFFFTVISVLFVVAIVIVLTTIRERRLQEKADDAVTLATSGVVRELMQEQKKNEQLVEDMADVASVHVSKKILKKLLHLSRENDIVSGGLWFEPELSKQKDIKKRSYFFHKDEEGQLKEIIDYDKQIRRSYREMEFYVLGRHLKEGETFWTKVYTDPVTKVRMVTVVAPIYREKRFIGVASLDLELGLQRNKIFADLVSSKDRYFFLTDRTSDVIVSSSKSDFNVTVSGLKKLRELVAVELAFFHKHLDSETSLVRRLLDETSDLKQDEATHIAYEMQHISGQHDESMQFRFKLLEEDPIFHEPSVIASYYFPHTGWYMFISIPEHVILGDIIEVYNMIIFITILFAVFAAFLGYLLIRLSIVKPLELIIEQVHKVELGHDSQIIIKDPGEIGALANSFNAGIKALHEAREKERRNEALLMQQSKMAAMGEMLDAVAHQWKQPLNALSMYAELIKINYEDGEVDQAYIEQFQKDIETQISHMTDTLATFRNFFRPTTELHRFDLRRVVDDVLLLAKDELTKNTIEVEVVEDGSLELYGSENEFKHLLLNIINNAKDAFNDNSVKRRKITIRIITDEKNPRLEIEDSAGGIPESVIDKIFQAHFTTKEQGKGTGIGLYMSSQIAQKHHAGLSVENRENGACFIVDFTELSFHA